MCTDTQSGVKCSCRNGYQLIGDKSCKGEYTLIIITIKYVIINECLTNNGRCPHNCINALAW